MGRQLLFQTPEPPLNVASFLLWERAVPPLFKEDVWSLVRLLLCCPNAIISHHGHTGMHMRAEYALHTHTGTADATQQEGKSTHPNAPIQLPHLAFGLGHWECHHDGP